MGPGGPRGLQNRCWAGFPVQGGFDSLALPPITTPEFTQLASPVAMDWVFYGLALSLERTIFLYKMGQAMKGNLLSDRTVRVARAGTHSDGNGLTLRVGTNGGRSWVLRYTWDGRPSALGLGSYPAVGLKEARALAADKRAEIVEGSRPTGAREAAAARRPAPPKSTFQQVAEQVIELRRPTWSSPRHATQWTESLTNHAYPAIGAMPIDKIASSHVLRMLAAIWNELPETSTRVKQRAQVVFDYAIAAGLRSDNPVAAVERALPRRPRLKEHHKAVAHAELPSAVAAIREANAYGSTRLALEFIILTAARAGEVRGMTWDEVDFEAACWTVPASRMKMRRPHRVPLSDRALAVLREAQTLHKRARLVFPGQQGQKPLSNMAFTMLLRRIGIEGVTHGFRSTFKDWCLSETSTPWAVSEAALAHNLGSSMEAAYARTDLFEKRRTLMNEWAAYIDTQ